jgi:hypothetical protein
MFWFTPVPWRWCPGLDEGSLLLFKAYPPVELVPLIALAKSWYVVSRLLKATFLFSKHIDNKIQLEPYFAE